MSVQQIFELAKQITEIQEQLKTELGAPEITIRVPNGELLCFTRNRGFFLQYGGVEKGLGEVPTITRIQYAPEIKKFVEKLRKNQQLTLLQVPNLKAILAETENILTNNQLRFTPIKEV